jgi:hypothetical protein
MWVEPELLKRAATLTLRQWGVRSLPYLPRIAVGAAAFVLFHLLAASAYLFAVGDAWPGLTAFTCGLLFVIWATMTKTMLRTLIAVGWFYVALGVGASLCFLLAAAFINDEMFLACGLVGLAASLVVRWFLLNLKIGPLWPRKFREGTSRLQTFDEASIHANEQLWQRYWEGDQ